MKKVLIIILSLFLLFSCKNKESKIEIENFYPIKEVDKVLPKIDKRSSEIQKILEKAEEYKNPLTYDEAEIIYESVQNEIKNYSWLYSALVYSIIEKESQYKKSAFNDKNKNNSVDYSYMQINEISRIDYNNHHKEKITSEQLMNDTTLNIKVGCWILNRKRESLIRNEIEPTEENIIKAYNCGEHKVIGDCVPQSTIEYQRKISEKIPFYILG